MTQTHTLPLTTKLQGAQINSGVSNETMTRTSLTTTIVVNQRKHNNKTTQNNTLQTLDGDFSRCATGEQWCLVGGASWKWRVDAGEWRHYFACMLLTLLPLRHNHLAPYRDLQDRILLPGPDARGRDKRHTHINEYTIAQTLYTACCPAPPRPPPQPHLKLHDKHDLSR